MSVPPPDHVSCTDNLPAKPHTINCVIRHTPPQRVVLLIELAGLLKCSLAGAEAKGSSRNNRFIVGFGPGQ